MDITVAGTTGWASPPAPRALLVHPGNETKCIHDISVSLLVPTRSFHHLNPEPLTYAHSADQNSHLYSHRYSHGGILGGAGMIPGFDKGSRGRHPHNLGRSNLQVGSGSSEHWSKNMERSRVLALLVPTCSRPLVPEPSPWPLVPSPILSAPTWPTGAGKGLPEIFAVCMGWTGPRCTGVGHNTSRLHIYSVAGRWQG